MTRIIEDYKYIKDELEQHKTYTKSLALETPLKFDFEKLSESHVKQTSRIAALNTELLQLKDVISQNDHVSCMNSLREKITDIEQKYENLQFEEKFLTFRQEINAKMSNADEKPSLGPSSLRESMRYTDRGLRDLQIQDLCPDSDTHSYADLTNTPHFTNPSHLLRLEERLIELEKERSKVEAVKRQVREALSKVNAIEHVVVKQKQVSKRTEEPKPAPKRNSSQNVSKEIIPPLDISRASRRASVQETERLVKSHAATDRWEDKENKLFLPGEAESLVMSAILSKANNERVAESLKMQHLQVSRSISPIQPISSRASFAINPENLPSHSLQEALRKRGINIQSGAQTDRRR